MTYAVGYVRRSVVSADSPGEASREAQEQAITRLAAAFSPGQEVVLQVDWGESGGKDDRPGYVAVKEAIESGEVSAVYAYSLSRLGRRAAELDAFFTLCRERHVKVTTQAEGALSSDTAMGQFLLQVMGAMAQLERELSRERTTAGLQARAERYHAAGLPVPPPQPEWGWRYVPRESDGLLVRERDPDIDLQVIADVFAEAGSMRRAAVLLNDRGVPAPKGGEWHMTPLRRTLERMADEGMIELPERSKPGRRPAYGKTASLFAGLLRCHCGRRLTPNVKRKQYYCAGGRLSSSHGRSAVTEAALLEVLRPEADLYVRTIRIESRSVNEDLAKRRAVIERRQAALDAKLDVGRLDPEAYKAATRELHQELADLHRDSAVSKTLRLDRVPSWDDVAATNAHLRRIWIKVQMDPEMVPTIWWRDARYRLDEERLAAEEAENLQLGGLLHEPGRLRLVDGGSAR